jgi:tRNA uridine 5-carboxymethylaminomethyl modification enzyme
MIGGLEEAELERLVHDIRYAGFLARERDTLSRLERSAERRIPESFSYRGLPGLSAEAAEKLERHRPRTLGQASRIPGVTPAAVTLLLARISRFDRTRESAA